MKVKRPDYCRGQQLHHGLRFRIGDGRPRDQIIRRNVYADNAKLVGIVFRLRSKILSRGGQNDLFLPVRVVACLSRKSVKGFGSLEVVFFEKVDYIVHEY